MLPMEDWLAQLSVPKPYINAQHSLKSDVLGFQNEAGQSRLFVAVNTPAWGASVAARAPMRRSGHSRTLCLNWSINFVLWICSIAPNPQILWHNVWCTSQDGARHDGWPCALKATTAYAVRSPPLHEKLLHTRPSSVEVVWVQHEDRAQQGYAARQAFWQTLRCCGWRSKLRASGIREER